MLKARATKQRALVEQENNLVCLGGLDCAPATRCFCWPFSTLGTKKTRVFDT